MSNEHDCPFCGGDPITGALAKSLGHRPDIAFSRLQKANRFIDEIIEAIHDDKIDTETCYTLAVQHGILKEVEMQEPCGEFCRCADLVGDDFPTTCARKARN